MSGASHPTDRLSAPEKRRLVAELLRKRAARCDSAPLSFAQERIWFLNQLEPASPFYNIPVALRLEGRLSPAALQQALTAVVARHASLRTRFISEGNQPMQCIDPPSPVPLRVIDLEGVPAPDRETELRRLLTAEARQPFDLSQDPMLRAILWRLGEAEHVLLLVLHHIVSDAWSIAILFEDLDALYQAPVAGRAAALSELTVSYADYARWQRRSLSGEDLDRPLAYWKLELAGQLPVLELPADRPRPAVQTFQGGWESVVLPAALRDGLEALSRHEKATLFMTLLAAFQTLLHRCTGLDEVIVASPVAGRNRLELERLIGVFVNTLLLRGDLAGDPTFRELLQRSRSVTLEALAHQELPFEKLVETLQPDRNLSQSPLAQVLFAFQNVPAQNLQLPGLTVTAIEVHTGTTKFDLTLSVIEDHGGLRCYAEYAADLFDAATIRRMLGHFQTLLEGIVADPDRRLSQLPLLSGAERHQLLVEWNQTRVEYPQAQGVHQLFEEQVRRTPDATAVVFEGQRLTYGELNARANRLAHHLQTLGVGPEGLAGICTERSVEMVVGLLAILKAGGAYVPLDPGYPKERLHFMLEDARVPVLLTQQRLLAGLPEHGARTICLDADWQRISVEPDCNPDSGVTAGNLAYVIYTSGSTGRPKGAMNVHRGLANRLLWMQDAYRLTADDCVLQKTPFSFDVSVWEFFWPLLVGARLAVARPGGHQDTAYLVRLIGEQQITTLHFVPSMLEAFLDAPGVEDRCTSLRRVICSGEALPLETQEHFFARLNCPLHNLYGPTEASIDVTAWTCERDTPRAIVPIGRPIANTQIFILDQHLQPVAVGVPGELHIGGVGLARGYLNRPELTAERFIPNPFSPEAGARLYKTGDRARYLRDGNIEFLGRLDHQVKLRGHRIEPGEVEAALGQHPAVQQNVVVLREDTPGDQRLIAYFVPEPDRAAGAGDLRRFLLDRLPEYAVPAAFVALKTLPLTPNGKLDRGALPAPDQTRGESAEPFIAPRTATEETLARIWCEMLGLRQVGVQDNFFASGGYSLLVTRVIARVRQTFQVELPMRRFFQTPTIAALAGAIEEILVAEISELSDDDARRAAERIG
ncbi:MAG: amino acid adenylation domain-containing protein [Limisphaerales bacterium]